MTNRDVYKLVVQGCLGGDHLLRDEDAFARDLSEEWEQLHPCDARGEALQPIHPSRRVARLHLAVCKARGLPLRELTRLLLDQPLKKGRQEALAWAWASVLHSARVGEIPFTYDELAEIRLSDAIGHHSVQYGPASYRILNDTGTSSMRQFLRDAGIRS
jgi:hypothetical protein